MSERETPTLAVTGELFYYHMPRGRPKKLETIEPESAEFDCVIDCVGTLYKSSGISVVDCLNKIDVGFVKSRATITIKNGEKTSTTILSPLRLKRLFLNDNYKLLLEKNLLSILK